MSTDFVLLPRGSTWFLRGTDQRARQWAERCLGVSSSLIGHQIEAERVDTIVREIHADRMTVTIDWED